MLTSFCGFQNQCPSILQRRQGYDGTLDNYQAPVFKHDLRRIRLPLNREIPLERFDALPARYQASYESHPTLDYLMPVLSRANKIVFATVLTALAWQVQLGILGVQLTIGILLIGLLMTSVGLGGHSLGGTVSRYNYPHPPAVPSTITVAGPLGSPGTNGVPGIPG